jgi:hypothetical protein
VAHTVHLEPAPTMSQPTTTQPIAQTHSTSPDPKALKILAKSIFKELKAQGYDSKQVVSLATELISLVTDELHGSNGQ